MNEARKLLARQVKSGRLKQERADVIAATITPQLDYEGFDGVDAVVEAVVENIKIKHGVLSEVEKLVRPDRSEEHTSELQSLMRISYAVFCLKNKTIHRI